MDFMKTFLYSQFIAKLPYPTYDFSNQTVIVTGSNVGLGFEAAKHFVRLHAAKVILAVRSVEKGHAAAKAIIESTGALVSTVEVWQLDMADYESVKRFAKKAEGLERLDVVVQNAGILTSKYSVVGGNESHITVNVVSPVLLAFLLLPKLRASAKKTGARGRFAFVGSDLHYIARFKEQYVGGNLFEALNTDVGIDMDDRYKVSKLLLLYATRAIADQSPVSPASPVIIDCLTPGACKSDIWRDESSRFFKIVLAVMNVVIARSTEVGSRTLVHAVKPDLEDGVHGAYLQNCEIYPNGANVESLQGRKMQVKFIDELLAKLEGIAPGVSTI